MEFKGTPAPWVVDDNGTFFDIRNADSVNNVADVCASRCVYDGNKHHKSGVAYANACLIAAAPELLEALRELIQSHEYSIRIGYERIIELGDDCDSPEIMITKDSSLNKAKAAIAKALGQQ
ncbi:TPA: hypothetical protein ACS7Z1_000030 [Providencia alcalifaciens]